MVTNFLGKVYKLNFCEMNKMVIELSGGYKLVPSRSVDIITGPITLKNVPGTMVDESDLLMSRWGKLGEDFPFERYVGEWSVRSYTPFGLDISVRSRVFSKLDERMGGRLEDPAFSEELPRNEAPKPFAIDFATDPNNPDYFLAGLFSRVPTGWPENPDLGSPYSFERLMAIYLTNSWDYVRGHKDIHWAKLEGKELIELGS
jgi:hypothetical protein